MLIKQMSFRQNFIACCLTVLKVDFGITLYAGIGIFLQLCQRYGFSLSDVLFGLQCLLPWSEDVPVMELWAVVALVLQYTWFCSMVGIVQAFWHAPSWPGVVRIPDYDLRVNILAGTCSRSDGVLWRCSEPDWQYQDYRRALIVLNFTTLALGVLTTPKTYVEYVAPFLYNITIWNIDEIYALDTVATTTMFTTIMIGIMLILLTVIELACYLWRRVRHS